MVRKKPSKSKAIKDVEAEIKSAGLEKLLEKISHLSRNRSGDPFRLDFLAGTIQKRPSTEVLRRREKLMSFFKLLL